MSGNLQRALNNLKWSINTEGGSHFIFHCRLDSKLELRTPVNIVKPRADECPVLQFQNVIHQIAALSDFIVGYIIFQKPDTSGK